ncbi:MAG: hypothetical protein LBN07_03800 [Christensenellaceae bacterium]|jgi:hypothetical protein|nr:hypothetical protein [Christensenellaceae bacterium]
MKKIFGVAGVLTIVGFIVVLMAACSSSFGTIAERGISEYRKNLFVAINDDLGVSFVSGKRENPYKYDGKCKELVEFGVLTVKFHEPFVGVNPSFTLYIDSFQYNGQLDFNPFDGTYVADIEKEFSDDIDISLRLHAGGEDYDMALSCVSKDFGIDYKQAFNVAIHAMQTYIEPHIKSGVLEGEIFIKFVGDNTMQLDTIYYYVYFVPKEGDSAACLIDIEGNIIEAG